MKVLFDTNVVLDLLFNRQPFAEPAQILFELVESGKIIGYIGATTVTTIDYLLTKSMSYQESLHIINKILKLFEVTPINRLVLEDALVSNFSDFEDAVLYTSAIHCDLQSIVTRDQKGFIKAKIPIYSPIEFIAVFNSI